MKNSVQKNNSIEEIYSKYSPTLLKELHILTRDGKLNQDSRRKLKQIDHLIQFIHPLIQDVLSSKGQLNLVDFGSGKSYLGFLLNDLICQHQLLPYKIMGIDIRHDLVTYCQDLAKRLSFPQMEFLHLDVSQAVNSNSLPTSVDVITALHACDTATDDAIFFALSKKTKHIVLVPCCQAEVASLLNKRKSLDLKKNSLTEIWRHPLHTREFGSHLTNVLRCLQLEAQGYDVVVTELVGWEHSMKNELIIASKSNNISKKNIAKNKLFSLISELGIEEICQRFMMPEATT
ncbi:MAG: SAM-dependent methyltransferase [Betaproteobacteria bacterium]|jgi:hypothetical protein